MMGTRVGEKTWARTSDYLRHTTFGSIVCYQDRVMKVHFLFGGAGGHIIVRPLDALCTCRRRDREWGSNFIQIGA